MLVARMVGFDANGIAVGAGFSHMVEQAYSHKIISLPSQNLDFIDYDVRGKTESQIRADIEKVI